MTSSGIAPEPFSSAGHGRGGLLIHVVIGALLLTGPRNVAKAISLVTSLTTAPYTHHVRFDGSNYEVFNLQLLLVYVIAVLGLNLATQCGILSVGHNAFFAFGAYGVAILTLREGLPFPLAALISVGVAGLVGALLVLPALRLGHFTLAMVTVGYAFVVRDLLLNWHHLTGGGDGLAGIRLPVPFDTSYRYYWLLVMAAVLAYMLCHNLIRSPWGRAGRAVADSTVAAQSLGIPVNRVRVRGFIVSAIITSAAGALYAPLIASITPDAFTVSFSLLIVLMVLLGGSGTVAGPLIGAVVLFRIPIEVANASNSPGNVSNLIYGVVLILSVMFLPRGAMSAWRWFAQWLKRQRAGAARRVGAPVRAIHELLAVDGRHPTPGSLVEATAVAVNLNGVQALDGLSLTVKSAEIHALIGPNGSGKTTFLNAVCGYLALDQGYVRLFGGQEPGARPDARARSGLARTFQTPILYDDLSAADNVMMALDQNGASTLGAYAIRLPSARREERLQRARSVELLSALGLGDRLDDSVGALPPGQRRLVELARVFALQPRVVVMDEPAAGLNSREIEELEEIVRTLRDAGASVLIVEHHVDLVMRLADVITVIDFGRKIAEGPPDEIRRDPAVMKAYLGTPKKGEAMLSEEH